MEYLGPIALFWVALLVFLIVGIVGRVAGVTRFARVLFTSTGAAALVTVTPWTWTLLWQHQLIPFDSLWLASLLTLFAFFMLIHFFGSPVRIRGSKRTLPLLNDSRITTRVAEMSKSMGIRPPCVRLLGSLAGSLDATAWAGCLPTPTVVLSDGVLHRLTGGECDAIIAHELAHFASGSLWIHAAVPCISAALAVLSMVLVPTPAALPIFLCIFCGLRRGVSRPIELICDRRAGETIGFDTMISSLSKVHAVHPVRAETLVGFLVYATTTHPHPDVRLAALRSRSRSLQDETVDDDRRLLFKHRLGGVLALVVWIMALVCAYIVGKNERLQWVIWTVCAVVVLSPTAFLLMALRNQLRLNRRRTGIRRSPMVAWLVLLLLVLGLLFMARYARWLSESHSETAASVLILICVPVTLVAILVWARISSRSVKLRSEVECALREREPARALAIAQTKPKVVRRDPVLRLNLSVARVLSGDRATAIEEVEQLVAGFPRFHAAKFNLSAFLLDVDPERSLRIAEELAVSLPKDPIPPIYAARALRRLGRFAEAEQATQRAIALDPRNGVARAVAAGIKIGLGEFDAARQLIDEAESFAPGDAFIKVAQAELELACGPVSSAQAAVDAAASAVHANPFTLLDHELRTLRQRLEGLVGSPTPILLFPVTPGIPST